MVQKTSPFIESKYGWNLGESGWNTGADENFLKFAFMLDNGVDGVVTSLPQTPVNGSSYYLTSDNRFYFAVDGTYYSSPCPKWFTFKLKTSGKKRIYDGSGLVTLPSDIDVSNILNQTGVNLNKALSDLASASGSSSVGFIQDVSTAVIITTQSKLRQTIHVNDFGASTSSSDNTLAFKNCIAFARAIGGATIKIGRGVYQITDELAFSPIVGVGFHNVSFEGHGAGSTTLDFSSAATGTNGINVVGWGGRINLKGFTVKNAKNIGIVLNNVERGSAAYISRSNIEDVIVDGSVGDGIRCTQTYMCSFRDIESRNNGGYGFNLRGSHTSMMCNRCWAGGDAAAPQGGNSAGGWMVNGLVYSSFESCSADNNAGPGWTIKATGGVTLTSCGSEANVGSGFLVVSDDNNTAFIPTPGINGLILDGCFAVGNGSASPATPNFLEFRSSGTRTGGIALRGCYDLINGVGSNVSIAYVGDGGALTVEEDSCYFAGTRSKTGNVFIKNASSQGKSSTVKLSTNTAIPNATSTAAKFTTFDTNTMVATLDASGALVIPSGVNRIKVSAAAFWDTNSVGSRTITIYKNGVSFYGGPTQKTTGSGFTGQAVTTSVVEVVPGDKITAVLYQDSGAALNLIANPNTYLSVDALG